MITIDFHQNEINIFCLLKADFTFYLWLANEQIIDRMTDGMQNGNEYPMQTRSIPIKQFHRMNISIFRFAYCNVSQNVDC